jgi:hypothetical protein
VTNFDDICTGLAANLAPLAAQGFQISPYLLDAPVPDTIQVAGLVAAQFDVAFRGSNDVVVDEYDIAIEVRIRQAAAGAVAEDSARAARPDRRHVFARRARVGHKVDLQDGRRSVGHHRSRPRL